jgi:hypothetical protein
MAAVAPDQPILSIEVILERSISPYSRDDTAPLVISLVLLHAISCLSFQYIFYYMPVVYFRDQIHVI